MNELCFQSACEIARALREKEVSALEVVETHLRRIEATHSTLNAVVTLAADRAMDEARAADSRQARGEPLGALHGVPVTIKDSIETAGILTTGGTTGLAKHVPERDAPVVARLREAGAIVLGKTNTPELTLGGESDNLIFGRTNNPYRLDRTPGGSSGGAAAIIAAGGAALDLGSDVGGSIREPAHYCGIAGIKPTTGRVPGTGHIPASYGAFDTFAQIGPMARRVEDIELALGIVSGIDWSDPSVVPMPLGSSTSITLDRLRVATYTDNGLMAPVAEIAEAVNDADAALAAGGVEVVRALPEAIPDAVGLIPRIRAAEGGAPVRYALDRAGTTRPSARLSYALDFPTPPPGNVLSDLMLELDLGARPHARLHARLRRHRLSSVAVVRACARLRAGRALRGLEPRDGLQLDGLAGGGGARRHEQRRTADRGAGGRAPLARGRRLRPGAPDRVRAGRLPPAAGDGVAGVSWRDELRQSRSSRRRSIRSSRVCKVVIALS